MTTTDEILAELETALEGRRALKTFINDMGYEFSGRRMLVELTRTEDDGQDRFLLFELKDEGDPGREVPFSFLFDPEQENGVILPQSYDRYQVLTVK